MHNDLLDKWRTWWQPLCNGLTHRGVANGLLLTGGWFWARIRGGYLLYAGPDRDMIDESRPVGAAGFDADEIREFPWAVRPAADRCWYTVRAVGAGGLESAATEPIGCGFIADAFAGGLPGEIDWFAAELAAQGRFHLRWHYSAACQTASPTEFRIYHDSATGQVDYAQPIAVVPGNLHRAWHAWLSEPYPDGTRVRFAVRAANPAGEGTPAVTAATADATACTHFAHTQLDRPCG